MKKTIVTLLLVMTSGILFAQLANSKWKGTLRGDNPQDVIIDFRKDTAVVYTVEDNSHVETMTYTVKDMVLSLMKIEGISDCDNSSPGKYRISLAGEVLYLKMVDDKCADRYEAIDSIKWVKWTDRPAAKGSTGFLIGTPFHSTGHFDGRSHVYHSVPADNRAQVYDRVHPELRLTVSTKNNVTIKRKNDE